MAALEVGRVYALQLFHELKKRYPEVPDEVVNERMRENNNDKEKCIQALHKDSPVYLFGKPTTFIGSQNDHIGHKFQELHITHEDAPSRQTSTMQHHVIAKNKDGGANIQSNLSWPVESTQNNLTPLTQGIQSPYTAPVVPKDFDPFVQGSGSKSPRQIPNINCYSGIDSSSGGASSPKSTGSPSEGRRAVKVYHYPSPPVTTSGTGATSSQQGSVFRIHFGKESGGLCTVSPQSQGQNWLISAPPTQHGQHSPELPTGHHSFTTPGVQATNQYTHSTQATIFINRNNNNGHLSPDRSTHMRTTQYSSFASGSDQHLTVQPNYIPSGHTSPVIGYSGPQHQSPQGYNKPLYVELKSTGPEGAQTQVRYYSTTPDRSPNYGFQGPPVSTANRYGGSGAPCNPPQTGQYQPGMSFHMPQSQNSGSNQSSCIFPHYPSQVAAHIAQHGIPVLGSRSSSLDSESGLFMQETEPVGHHMTAYGHLPMMSPASSHSSLSSESSNRDVNQRPRSGSMQEEAEYTHALLIHQRARMAKLQMDYEAETRKLEKLQSEVTQMEKNMFERQSARRHSFPTVEDVSKMRQNNRKLQTDLQVMLNEIDMFKNGQTPFSIIDPLGQQNFFKNMPTGQRNSIYSPQSRNSQSPPPVPPRLNHVPPAPPSQPPAGSGDSEEGEQWNCTACTFLNHPALDKCECCEMPRLLTSGS